MVLHLKTNTTSVLTMEERLEQLLDGDKAIQLAQVAADAIKDAIDEDDSHFAEACRHRDNFYSATNPTLFDDLLDITESKAKQIVIDLYIKK